MPERPNLLIVMVDQMQAALLGEDAPVELPCLRQLQRVSTRFTSAFTPAPICTPARASFQLGLPVHRHGVIGNGQSMPDGPTLADRLNDAGYATSYVGKWHLDRDSGRGWRRFITDHELRVAPFGGAVMDGVDAPHEGVADYSEDDHVDGRVAGRGLEELRQLQRGDHPYALMISFHGPHAPYYLPREWHGRFDPMTLPLPDTFDASFEGKPQAQQRFRCRAWGQRWDEAKWRRVRAAYFGACAMIDHLIGRILDEVDLDNTAVLFVSDHGENNGHLRMIYKGPMMYDTLVRIPALLHLPGQAAAADDDRLVDLTDFTATLLALAGSPASVCGATGVPGAAEGIEGHDVTQPDWPGRDAVVSEFYEANWVTPVWRQRVAMLRDRRWKYVYNEGDRGELYDLRDRPMEVVNRIDEPARRPVVERMRDELARRVPWVGESITTRSL